MAILNDTAAAEAAAVLRLAARFPELRRDCDAGIIEIPRRHNMDTTMVHWIGCPGAGCSTCHGTGWLPVSPAEAMYWLVGQVRFHTLVQHRTGDYSAGWCAPDGGGRSGAARGPTPLLALAAAVEAAEGRVNAIQ